MAWTHTKDIKVKVGTYMKNGKETGRYKAVGKVLQDGDKQIFMMDRTFNVAGVPVFGDKDKESVMLSLFDVDAKDGVSSPHKGYTPTGEVAGTVDDNELIPF